MRARHERTDAALRRWLYCFCFGLFAMCFSAQPFAQSSGTVPATPRPAMPQIDWSKPQSGAVIRELVSRMSDQQVRHLLLQRLDAQRETQTTNRGSEHTLLSASSNAVAGIGQNFVKTIRKFPTLLSEIEPGLNALLGERPAGTLPALIAILGMIVVGSLAIQAGVRRYFSPKPQEHVRTNLVHAVQQLSSRALFDAFGLLLMSVVAYVLTQALFERPIDRETAWRFIISFVILVSAIALVMRFVVAPRRKDLRLVALDDHQARQLSRHMIVVGLLIGAQQFFLPWYSGGEVAVQSSFGFFLNFTLYAYVVWALYDSRMSLVRMMIGTDGMIGDIGGRVAKLWPAISIALCIGMWVLVEGLAAAEHYDLLRGQQHVALLLIIFAPITDTALRGLVRHFAPPMIGDGGIAQQAHQATMRSYLRIGRVVLISLQILLIATVWGISLRSVADSGFGAHVAQNVVSTLIVLLAGYVIWEYVNLWINRRIAKEQTASGMSLSQDDLGSMGGAGLSRMATVLPIARVLLSGIIIVITALLALGQFGLDITPLLAGAGIAGLAIGFGAQTLVRDVVSGMFFLIDDAFRIGEYVDIGQAKGTVEKISLRSFRLRHHRGPLNTVPYGTISNVENFSRDWVIMKLLFTVPFDTDTEKVRKIFKRIGQDLMETDFADDLLQPFKSQGVLEVNDVGIVIRGKFTARPGTQFLLRREIFKRVQEAFAENGIDFARREVRVDLGENSRNLSKEQVMKIGAAVAEPPVIKPA